MEYHGELAIERVVVQKLIFQGLAGTGGWSLSDEHAPNHYPIEAKVMKAIEITTIQ